MNDTNPKIEKIYHKMLMEKSYEERFLMGVSMFETTKEIILSTIEDKENWYKEFFLRLYKDDFDELTKEKILKHLEKVHSKPRPQKITSLP